METPRVWGGPPTAAFTQVDCWRYRKISTHTNEKQTSTDKPTGSRNPRDVPQADGPTRANPKQDVQTFPNRLTWQNFQFSCLNILGILAEFFEDIANHTSICMRNLWL